MQNYSSCKDNKLNEKDLWQVFKPMHMKAVEQIVETREKR